VLPFENISLAMKFSTAFTTLFLSSGHAAAFIAPGGSIAPCRSAAFAQRTTILKGYLDDLSSDLAQKDDQYDEDKESLEATTLDRSMVDRYGPGSLADFVDFTDEFDGGDGQMGVAGDGNKGLEAMGGGPTINKKEDQSRMRSAKNAWGNTSSGYADELRAANPGMDTSRAQQMENWQNQREVYNKQQTVRNYEIADQSRQDSAEMNWRDLAKFGVERNQDFDLDETFGAVVPGEIKQVLEFRAQLGNADVYVIPVSESTIRRKMSRGQ
jgi:hypothetical protein